MSKSNMFNSICCRQNLIVIASALLLIMCPLMKKAYGKGSACILEIKPELFQTSIAKDVLARNLTSKVKLLDSKIEFTNQGLRFSATKEVTFFPDIPFSALIDVDSPKYDYLTLSIREAKVVGVELKWLSGIVTNYLETKIAEGKLSQYFTIYKRGWAKDSDGSCYKIILKLKPQNIVQALENPVIKKVIIDSTGLILVVDADR